MKLAALLALAASSSVAFAQIGYVGYTQTRSLSASASIGGGSNSQSASASGSGIYNDSVSALASVQIGPNNFAQSTSLTTITSDLQSTFISITGTFAQTVGAFAGSGATRGRVTCDVSFELTSPYFYNLSGVVGVPGISPPNDPVFRDVTLNGPGGYSVAPGPFLFTGVLGPGIYTLHVDVESRKPGWDTPGFQVLFQIPQIPAPGTATLAVAALGLITRRRR